MRAPRYSSSEAIPPSSTRTPRRIASRSSAFSVMDSWYRPANSKERVVGQGFSGCGKTHSSLKFLCLERAWLWPRHQMGKRGNWALAPEGLYFQQLAIPRRLKQAAEKEGTVSEFPEKSPSGAKAPVDSIALMYGLEPVPFTETSFSAACKAVSALCPRTARLKPLPPQSKPDSRIYMRLPCRAQCI